jgi:hypothetical protein
MKVTLQGKSFTLNREELEIEKEAEQSGVKVAH